MAGRPVRCLIGVHSYVREHLPDERLQRPGGEVCRLCGKRRDTPGIPLGLLGG